jgi:nicotinamidase-related amidase
VISLLLRYPLESTSKIVRNLFDLYFITPSPLIINRSLNSISFTMPVQRLFSNKTLFFLCDMQTRFRSAVYSFEDVVNTSNKMLRVANVLGCEVVVTEQNPKALGPTVPEINLESIGALHLGSFPKTTFSMVTPPVRTILENRPAIDSIVLFGIETHVCVLQTALELLDMNYKVHVLADGVSSCNKEETPFALSRIAQSGGIITTSESAAFQLMGDSGKPNFKAFSAIIKEEKDKTQTALTTLAQYRSAL